MDTSSGRIYEPEEMTRRLEAFSEGLVPDEHQPEFVHRLKQGGIVPVSEDVARQQRTGQRVDERRRKRKAAKAARRANR